MILVLTDAFDAHADRVIQELEIAQAKYFRMNLDVTSLKASHITYEGDCWAVSSPTGSFVSKDICCIWCRKSTISLTIEEEDDQSNGFRLWKSEWNRALFGLYSALADRYWMNPLRASALADNKFFQCKIAIQCGLTVPEFITSNKKSCLLNFLKENEKVALKFMSQQIYKMPDGSVRGLYVNRIGSDDLENFGEINENPVTLQRYIEKDFEVRYTFIEDAHLACRIDSQQSERARVDWRRYDLKNTPHGQIEVPSAVRENVSRLMRKLQLPFGALDFAVDSRGIWWFLEVNSAGQWLWIEDLVSLPICATISRCLTRHLGV